MTFLHKHSLHSRQFKKRGLTLSPTVFEDGVHAHTVMLPLTRLGSLYTVGKKSQRQVK